MKNRLLVVVLAFIIVSLFITENLTAQVTSEANSNWIGLTSYSGFTKVNAFRFSININHTQPVDYPNWSLLVRVNSPITNGQKTFNDPSKISIRLNSISGINYPTIAQVGASQTPIPLSFNDQYIIQSSNHPLQTDATQAGWYKKFTFDFDIIIAGGSYLENLKTYTAYIMNLTFSVLSESGQLLSQQTPQVQMQIAPEGTPPSGPTYGIEVKSNARNGLLEFKTITDYVNGVSQTYDNGLSIVSTTSYAVQVRSLKTNFESGSNTLPVNAVSLEIKDPNNSGVGGTIPLSENAQTVFSTTNLNNQARLFNIRYFTQPNDERMLQAKPASYETTLMYTLVPQ
jgi:hypothetical protein